VENFLLSIIGQIKIDAYPPWGGGVTQKSVHGEAPFSGSNLTLSSLCADVFCFEAKEIGDICTQAPLFSCTNFY